MRLKQFAKRRVEIFIAFLERDPFTYQYPPSPNHCDFIVFGGVALVAIVSLIFCLLE